MTKIKDEDVRVSRLKTHESNAWLRIAGRGALPGQHEAFQLLSEEAGAGAAAVTSAVEFLAVLHAQRHSRRIEYTAQVAGHGRHSGDTHNLFGLLLSLLLSGLSWTTCDMCGRGHGIARPGGFLSRKGGGNSSSTGIPTTTTTCSWPLDAADYYLAYLVSVYQ